MENFTNETGKWMSLAESNKGLSSHASGDYGNSAELSQGLGHITNMVATNNALGMLPLMGNSMPASPPGMPSGTATPDPTGLTGAVAAMGNPANPQQMPSTDVLSTMMGMAMAKMANPPKDPSQCAPYQYAKQHVISEPCTVSQPMNASLRESHSKGGFYFLPNS
jgi:hypothetical protein